MGVQTKQCSACNETKPRDAFSDAPDGNPRGQCKACRCAYERLRKYGLTVEDTIERLLEQNGRCPICTTPIDVTSMHVDHDHACCPYVRGGAKTCGRCVRQLLCGDCNILLGRAKDSPDILQRAIDYLRRHDG